MTEPADDARAPADRKPAWRGFVLVVLVALVARLVHLSQLQESPLFQHPIMDAGVHHEWAQQFAAGEEWAVDRRTGEAIPYFRAPFYVWFLGTVYKVFGVDAGFPPRVLQSILGALSCGLVFLVAARVFDRRVAITAGLAAALSWVFVYFDNELLLVSWIVFFNLLMLWLLLIAAERRSWYWWSGAGLALGLEAITRPNILLFAPAVCLWILAMRLREKQFALGIAHCFAFGLALLAPILPITARNAAKADDAVLIASQGGVNFYIGNNELSDGVTAVVPGTPPDWWGGYDATHAMAEEALGRKPTASEVSQHFFDLAFDWWGQHFGDALAHTAYKARLFAYRQEYANNKDIYLFSELFTPVDRFLPIGLWIVMPLGLLGFCLVLRRPGRFFPLWGYALAYTASVVIFFVSARFRIPVAYVLTIFAAHAGWWLFDRIRRAQWIQAGPALLGLLLFVRLAHWSPIEDFEGFGRMIRNTEEGYWTLGLEHAKRGEWAEAIPWLDAMADSIEEGFDEMPDGRKQMMLRILSMGLAVKAEALEKLGRHGPAITTFQEVLATLPPQAFERAIVCKRIALLFERQGRQTEALPYRQEIARLKQLYNRPGPVPTELMPLGDA